MEFYKAEAEFEDSSGDDYYGDEATYKRMSKAQALFRVLADAYLSSRK